MVKDICKTSLWFGIVTFLFIMVMLCCGGGYVVLFVAFLVPGIGYGMILAGSVENPGSGLSILFFIILSMVLNVFGVWRIYADFLGDKPYVPLEMVTYSSIAAVALSVCYDRLLALRFSLYYTIAMPALLGIAASLFSAGCMYLLVTDKHNEFISTLLWVGMFTIFPLWQYFFGLNVRNYNRVSHPANENKI